VRLRPRCSTNASWPATVRSICHKIGFAGCDRYADGLEAAAKLSCPLLFVLGHRSSTLQTHFPRHSEGQGLCDLKKVQTYATQWMWKYTHDHPDMVLGGNTPK